MNLCFLIDTVKTVRENTHEMGKADDKLLLVMNEDWFSAILVSVTITIIAGGNIEELITSPDATTTEIEIQQHKMCAPSRRSKLRSIPHHCYRAKCQNCLCVLVRRVVIMMRILVSLTY